MPRTVAAMMGITKEEMMGEKHNASNDEPKATQIHIGEGQEGVSDIAQSSVKLTETKKKPSKFSAFFGKKEEDATPVEEPKVVSYFSLFSHSTSFEKVMIVTGCLCSIVHGALFPMFSILFGDIIEAFGPNISSEDMLDAVTEKVLMLIYLGLVAFVTAGLQVFLLMLAAQRQGRRMRRLYFRSLMSQEMDWYDGIVPAELTSRVSGCVSKVEDGIGDKLGSFLQYIAMFVAGFIIGFIYGWKLTLVVLSAVPVLAFCGGFLAKWSASISSAGQAAYAHAGGVAEEALSMIRTVVAFGGEEREKRRYSKELQGAYKLGIQQGNAQGLGLGVTMGCIMAVYALGFWYGNHLVQLGEMEAGDVITVFFSVVMGGMAVGQAAPSFSAFAVGRGAAYHLFEVIDRVPVIDTLSNEGKVLDQVMGDITFENVDFTYSSRKDELILTNMNCDIKRGETLALVGHSGCGKSTTIQLLERFYDPLRGAVKLDGVDIRELNVQWFRSNIGLVSQMPTLFATSIADNIALGAPLAVNKNYNPSLPCSSINRKFVTAEVSQQQIENAAKMANAHNFIMKLPQGYSTVIGERGAQISGGQKQRIAIARALVKEPKILLLDEATSALDSHSERTVQDALEKAAQGRTTVVIAHRLSTIKNANKIAVVEKGTIVELGNNADLMAIPNGKYRGFVELQQLAQETEEGEEKNNDDNVAQQRMKSAVRFASTGRPVSTARKISAGQQAAVPGQLDASTDSGLSSDEDDNETGGKKKTKVKQEVAPGLFTTLLKRGTPDWHWMTLGTLTAMVNGAVWPLFAIVFSEIIAVILVNDEDQVRFWVLMFVAVGVLTFFSQWLTILGFAVAGERMTHRMRNESFDAMVHQSMGWFDSPDNGVGTLTTRLSMDAADVQKVTGSVLNVMVTQVSGVVVGLIIAFTAAWKVAFVVLAMVPAIGFGAALQMKQMAGFAANGSKVYRHAGKIASEAVDNVRTVVSLGSANYFMDRYDMEVEKPARQGVFSALAAGVGFGFSEFMMFAVWGVAMYYGAVLATKGEVSFADMMKAISAVVFGAMTVGQVAAVAPDAAKAKVAATNVLSLIALKPEIDTRDPTGLKPEWIVGNVSFENVHFEYPTRSEVPVLKGLTVAVQNGHTLALVGESGCGKSTLVGLLERFYNPRVGSAMVDGVPVQQYNLNWLRAQMGIVSQEPDLFNTSVRENILYGLPEDQLAGVSDEMVVAAAKLANAHDFIMALPEGYSYEVGNRGYHLSGGQRQRIAIARAMIRNPRILLLDEATSALDSESEKVVQVALDNARKGRTTLTIAHRLATIQDADVIAVVREGGVAERGTHGQLLGMKGLYAHLVVAQSQAA